MRMGAKVKRKRILIKVIKRKIHNSQFTAAAYHGRSRSTPTKNKKESL